MTRPGAMYLSAIQGANAHRIAAGIAAAHGMRHQLPTALAAVQYYDARAQQARALGRAEYSARKAARVPRGYHADAPVTGVQSPATGTR